MGCMGLNPAHLHSPTTFPLETQLCLLHTEGAVSAASASLIGSGGAFYSWETDRAEWNQVIASQCQ